MPTLQLPTELAVIDLGSNTVRLSIFACHANFNITRIYQSGERLRLIEALDANANLPPYAIQRVIETLQAFKRWCTSAKVPHIVVAATSAVREAANQAALIDQVYRATGLVVHVLSIEEESRYGVLGVMAQLHLTNGLIFDLGGGSLQLAHMVDGVFRTNAGLPLGALRVSQQFPHHQAWSAGQVEALKRLINSKLTTHDWLKNSARKDRLVGIGGVVRALARVDQAVPPGLPLNFGDYTLQAAVLDELIDRLSGMGPKLLMDVPGLAADRVDMILVGAIIVRELMRVAGAKGLQVSEASIREGIAQTIARGQAWDK